MSYSAFPRPPQPRPGLKLTVRFVIRESNGRPIITILPEADYLNLISLMGNPRWFMPWEERLQATVTFATERDEFRRYIREQMLWCNRTGGLVQATDDRIVLAGIHEVLQEGRARAQEAQSSRVERRLWSPGPVISRKVEQFIGLFRMVEVDRGGWQEVKELRDGWGKAFQELVKGRRELRIGDTKVRELPGGVLVEGKARLVFWSSGM